jgi:diamine N-acetyltransferase
MQVLIRRATVKDAEALAILSRETFFDTFTGTCTEEDMQEFLEEYFNIEQVKKELADENDFYFFAEIDAVPAGYIRIMEDYSNFALMKKWKALELKRIYVDKKFHGKGIAQQMMKWFGWVYGSTTREPKGFMKKAALQIQAIHMGSPLAIRLKLITGSGNS